MSGAISLPTMGSSLPWLSLKELNLITIGGLIGGVDCTGRVYCFKEQSQEWEEFLKPMPTARYGLSVVTTQSTIVASGGEAEGELVPCATVEVYSSETSQWYTADPLYLYLVGA